MPTETQLEQRVAALQSDLNQKDEQIDALEFTDNDRELSRRDWFDEAQRLEKENEELKADIKLLKSDLRIANDTAALGAKMLAERDALLRGWLNLFPKQGVTGGPITMQKERTIAALSASAEPIPRCPGCGYTYQDCREQMDHYLCGLPEPSAPKDWCTTMARPKSKCGCPDCGSSIVQICAQAERGERADDLTEKAEFTRWRLSAQIDQRGAWSAWQARAALERKP